MSGQSGEVLGRSERLVRQIWWSELITFTANTAVVFLGAFVPIGLGPFRIKGVHVAGSAIPSDADGTMLLDVDVNDVSEGADDVIVQAQDLETLIVAANRGYECTLAAEGAEKERNINDGDAFKITLTSNSAAIDTNTSLRVGVEVVPLYREGDQDVVKHENSY